MTLKSSFSDKFFPRLLGRFYQFNWLTALWSVALFFVFPVAGALIFSIEALTNGSWTVAETSSVLAGQIGTACILSIFMAVLTPNTFNYLNSRKQLDFYHSQPVSRKELFWRNYLVGLFSFLIPLTIGFVLDFGIALLIPGLAWQNVFVFLKGYAVCVGTYFTANALCILAVMLCGNRFISLLTGIYFCGLPAMMFGMAMYFITSFANTFAYEKNLYNILSQITPVCYFIDFVVDPDKLYGDYFWATLIWLVIGAGILFASLGLYLKRKSESAGKSLSFPKAIIGIKYPLTVFVAWIGGLLFNAMGDNALWMVFGFCTFGILTFCIVSGLEKFEFKAAFRGFGKLALTVGIYVLCVCLIFGSCIFFDRRTTKNEHINSIDIGTLNYSENAYGGTVYHANGLKNIEGEDAIKALNYIATLAAKQEHTLKMGDRISISGLFNNNVVLEDYVDDTAWIGMSVTLHTDFGTYTRQYGFRTDMDGEVLENLKNFSVSPGGKKSQAERALSSIDTGLDKFTFTAGTGIPGKSIMKSLYEALKTDMENASVEDYKAECMGYITISYKYAPYYYFGGGYGNDEYSLQADSASVPVYSFYKNTLAVIEEHGIKLFQGDDGTAGSFTVNGDYTTDEYESGYEKGWAEGYENGKRDGEKGVTYEEWEYGDGTTYGEGYSKGYLEGYDQGYNVYGDAFNQGYQMGLKEGEKRGMDDRDAGEAYTEYPYDWKVYTEYRNGYYEGFMEGYNRGYNYKDYY